MNRFSHVALLCFIISFTGRIAGAQELAPGGVLAGLDRAHPRLMLKDAVLLVPVPSDGVGFIPPEIKPLAEW